MNFKYKFLFEELVKRDFNKKYKRSVLGIAWSLLSPLLMLLVMSLMFKNFFGRNKPHYTVYLFIGQTVFSFFTEATTAGMTSMVGSASIYSKIKVPKFLFICTSNTLALINFALTSVVVAIFVIVDDINITFKFFTLFYPIICLIILNIGMSLILSTYFVMFKDTQYLYSVFTRVLTYLSAIFYTTDSFARPELFFLNPVYTYIYYCRSVILDNTIPGFEVHVICLAHCLIILCIGLLIYERNNKKFIYYI